MNNTNTKIVPTIMLGITLIFVAGTLLEIGAIKYIHQQIIESHKIVWLIILSIGMMVNFLDIWCLKSIKTPWILTSYKLWLGLQGAVFGLSIIARPIGWSNNDDFISYLAVGSIIAIVIFWMYLMIASEKMKNNALSN